MPPTCPIRTAWSASGGLERQGKPQKRQHSSPWSSFRQSPSNPFHFERLFRQSDRTRPQIALKISLSHFFDKKTGPQFPRTCLISSYLFQNINTSVFTVKAFSNSCLKNGNIDYEQQYNDCQINSVCLPKLHPLRLLCLLTFLIFRFIQHLWYFLRKSGSRWLSFL